jgi:hypothetical protein
LIRSYEFENMIIDEVGIEKLEDLLAPFQYGINQMAPTHFHNNPESFQIDNLMGLISQWHSRYCCRRPKAVQTYRKGKTQRENNRRQV